MFPACRSPALKTLLGLYCVISMLSTPFSFFLLVCGLELANFFSRIVSLTACYVPLEFA
jgi:hypothetical protein